MSEPIGETPATAVPKLAPEVETVVAKVEQRATEKFGPMMGGLIAGALRRAADGRPGPLEK